MSAQIVMIRIEETNRADVDAAAGLAGWPRLPADPWRPGPERTRSLA
jgi:hypothetical protein